MRSTILHIVLAITLEKEYNRARKRQYRATNMIQGLEQVPMRKL